MANSALWNPEKRLGIKKEKEAPSEQIEGDTSKEKKEKKEHISKKASQQQQAVPFHVGDTVRVHYRLLEKEKEAGKTKRQVVEKVRERIQVFEGLVIAIRGKDENCMFTIRRVGKTGLGVERVFPLLSPWIQDLEVKRYGKVRRAKLYYIRKRKGKAATYVKEKKKDQPKKRKKTAKKSIKAKKTVRVSSKKTTAKTTPRKKG